MKSLEFQYSDFNVIDYVRPIVHAIGTQKGGNGTILNSILQVQINLSL